MIMTPIKTMAAYRAINEITGCVLPYKVARGIHTLKRKLFEEFETILETEKNMVNKYNGKYLHNTYEFTSPEDAQEFHKEYEQFLHQEDDIDLPKVIISEGLENLRISSDAIEALDGIVVFEE